jgi:hypothetical protein
VGEALEIPCSVEKFPCFQGEQGIRRNTMELLSEFMPSRTDRHRAGRILKDSLIISLLAGVFA